MSVAYFAVMAPEVTDSLNTLLIKAGYWAQRVSELGSGPVDPAMYPSMNPQTTDSLQVLAVKLTYWLKAISDGGTGGATLWKNSNTGDVFVNDATMTVAATDPTSGTWSSL